MKQKGYTVIELLLVVAVGGILIFGTVNAIFQVVVGTNRTNSQVVALSDVHHAALQIKEDLQMAQMTEFAFNTPGDHWPLDGLSVTILPGIFTLKLSWTDYTSFDITGNQIHTSRYELWGSELHRTYDEDETPSVSIVGRNINSVDFTQHGRVIDVVISATKGDVNPKTETLEFSVYLRGVVE
jgi:prepilin-type N-terminal cleavage/methylation domain-containing protein